MMRLILILFFALWLSLTASNASAQDVCPSGSQCVPQATFNQMVDKLNELVEARVLIANFTKERAAADAALTSALKTIETYKNLDEINNTIIVKQRDMMELYEKTVKLYVSLVESLEKQLRKPKSGFQKFMEALKTVTYVLAGVALGRGI